MSIKHPHIIKLYKFFDDSRNFYFQYEYAASGSLRNKITKGNMKEEEIFVYFIQACLGLEYLHKKKIIHRDLKVI